jgi:Viral BACON domain
MLSVCLGFLSLEALAQNGGVITMTAGSGGSGLLAYIQVNIGPKEALAAGAQWSVRGTDVWYSNPPWTAALPAGKSAVLEFKPVPNWDLPPNQNLTLPGGTLTKASALYTRSAQLAVSPAGGLAFSGSAGGPFKPSKVTYTLSNSGGAKLSWKGTTTSNWLSLSATNGTLAGGARTTITVTINANAYSLAEGTYTDTISFTNLTNGLGNTSRSVTLVVRPTAKTKQDPAIVK